MAFKVTIAFNKQDSNVSLGVDGPQPDYPQRTDRCPGWSFRLRQVDLHSTGSKILRSGNRLHYVGQPEHQGSQHRLVERKASNISI